MIHTTEMKILGKIQGKTRKERIRNEKSMEKCSHGDRPRKGTRSAKVSKCEHHDFEHGNVTSVKVLKQEYLLQTTCVGAFPFQTGLITKCNNIAFASLTCVIEYMFS